MQRFTLSFALLALLAVGAPAWAGVYVTDKVDAVSAFCQAVTTTKDVYCPRAKVDCRMVRKKQVGAFVKMARQCVNDPGSVSEDEAARLMAHFQENQGALCCMALTDKPAKTKSRK